MDEHQLTSLQAAVFFVGSFGRQTDRPHLGAAVCPSVAGLNLVDMAGMKAVGAVVAVLHAGKASRGGDAGMAVQAGEVLLIPPLAPLPEIGVSAISLSTKMRMGGLFVKKD